VDKKTRDVQEFYESVLVLPLRICLKDCNAVVELRTEKTTNFSKFLFIPTYALVFKLH